MTTSLMLDCRIQHTKEDNNANLSGSGMVESVVKDPASFDHELRPESPDSADMIKNNQDEDDAKSSPTSTTEIMEEDSDMNREHTGENGGKDLGPSSDHSGGSGDDVNNLQIPKGHLPDKDDVRRSIAKGRSELARSRHKAHGQQSSPLEVQSSLHALSSRSPSSRKLISQSANAAPSGQRVPRSHSAELEGIATAPAAPPRRAMSSRRLGGDHKPSSRSKASSSKSSSRHSSDAGNLATPSRKKGAKKMNIDDFDNASKQVQDLPAFCTPRWPNSSRKLRVDAKDMMGVSKEQGSPGGSRSRTPPRSRNGKTSRSGDKHGRSSSSNANAMQLHIVVLKGKDLAAKDRNLLGQKTSSDPYVKVSINSTIDDKDQGGPVTTETPLGQTQTILKTLNPEWKAPFAVHLPKNVWKDPNNLPSLKLDIYDYDEMTEDDHMGLVTIPLALFPPKEFEMTEWYDVDPESCRNASGRVQVQLKTTFCRPKGSVVVLDPTDLETEKQKDSRLPSRSWSYATPKETGALDEASKEIGELPAFCTPRRSNASRKLRVDAKDMMGVSKEQGSPGGVRPHAATQSRSDKASRHEGKPGRLASGNMEAMQVHILVQKGEDLAAKDRNLLGQKTSSDPYVKVSINTTIDDKDQGGPVTTESPLGQTQTIVQSLCPEWNATFAVHLPRSVWKDPNNLPSLKLDIYDYDEMTEDDHMGLVTIPLALFPPKEFEMTEWYDVDPESCRNASGRVQVQLKTRFCQSQGGVVVLDPKDLDRAIQKENSEAFYKSQSTHPSSGSSDGDADAANSAGNGAPEETREPQKTEEPQEASDHLRFSRLEPNATFDESDMTLGTLEAWNALAAWNANGETKRETTIPEANEDEDETDTLQQRASRSLDPTKKQPKDEAFQDVFQADFGDSPEDKRGRGFANESSTGFQGTAITPVVSGQVPPAGKGPWTCEACEYPNKDAAHVFCGMCGTGRDWCCPACSHDNKSSFSFCGMCGGKKGWPIIHKPGEGQTPAPDVDADESTAPEERINTSTVKSHNLPVDSWMQVHSRSSSPRPGRRCSEASGHRSLSPERRGLSLESRHKQEDGERKHRDREMRSQSSFDSAGDTGPKRAASRGRARALEAESRHHLKGSTGKTSGRSSIEKPRTDRPGGRQDDRGKEKRRARSGSCDSPRKSKPSSKSGGDRTRKRNTSSLPPAERVERDGRSRDGPGSRSGSPLKQAVTRSNSLTRLDMEVEEPDHATADKKRKSWISKDAVNRVGDILATPSIKKRLQKMGNTVGGKMMFGAPGLHTVEEGDTEKEEKKKKDAPEGKRIGEIDRSKFLAPPGEQPQPDSIPQKPEGGCFVPSTPSLKKRLLNMKPWGKGEEKPGGPDLGVAIETLPHEEELNTETEEDVNDYEEEGLEPISGALVFTAKDVRPNRPHTSRRQHVSRHGIETSSSQSKTSSRSDPRRRSGDRKGRSAGSGGPRDGRERRRRDDRRSNLDDESDYSSSAPRQRDSRGHRNPLGDRRYSSEDDKSDFSD
jgi:hypothetical protein